MITPMMFDERGFEVVRALPPRFRSPELLDLALDGLSGALADFSVHPPETCLERLFRYLINASQLILHREVSRVSGRRLRALDIDRNEIFVRVWERFVASPSAHDPSYHSFGPLFTLNVKYAIWEIARERQYACVPLLSDVPAFEYSAEAQELAERIRAALQRLQPAETTLIDALGQGLTTAEIALLLQLSADSVRQRIHRIRERLTQLLADCGVALNEGCVLMESA